MIQEETKALMEGYGWIYLGPQKNWWMLSFRQEESNLRMDIYYTKGTVQVQGEEKGNDKIYYNINSVEQLEKILIEIK